MQVLLKEMASVCPELLNWQLGIISRMRQELGDSAGALGQTAMSYSHTDQRNAARLDQAYGSGQSHTTGTGRAR
jgi:hypothetical protein